MTHGCPGIASHKAVRCTCTWKSLAHSPHYSYYLCCRFHGSPICNKFQLRNYSAALLYSHPAMSRYLSKAAQPHTGRSQATQEFKIFIVGAQQRRVRLVGYERFVFLFVCSSAADPLLPCNIIHIAIHSLPAPQLPTPHWEAVNLSCPRRNHGNTRLVTRKFPCKTKIKKKNLDQQADKLLWTLICVYEESEKSLRVCERVREWKREVLTRKADGTWQQKHK